MTPANSQPATRSLGATTVRRLKASLKAVALGATLLTGQAQADLYYFHKISLKQALKSSPIEFLTIDNQQIQIAIDEVISPDTTHVIEGKGMPIYNNDPLGTIKMNGQRGNLIVKFDI